MHPKPCKYDYFKSAKTHAFPPNSAFFTGDYPATNRWRLFVSLAAFGALIEAVQAIPVLHRDPSLLDWLADCGAVAITMGLMAFVGKIVGAAGNTPAEQS